MSENLKLWKLVEKTDPKMTKRVNQRGGYTSISPQYQLKLATEQFGSYGDGWGLSSSEFDYVFFDLTGVIVHKAVFFYTSNGKRIEFKITNSIEAYNTKSTRFDTDAFKKVETNTISKALSKLGFNADIFMGLFDDVDYFNQVSLESHNVAQNAKESAMIVGIEEFKKEFNTYTNLLKESENMATLNMMTKQYKNKISRKCTELKINAEKYISTFETIYNETKLKLEKPND